MNHNFADWELTQLLPENNMYLPKNHKYYCFMKSYTNNPLIKWDVRITGSRKTGEYLRDAFTWEDVRLYLKEKGYIINIIADEDLKDFPVMYYFDVILIQSKVKIKDTKFFDTYEEARREAIIYCLNLINNGENN